MIALGRGVCGTAAQQARTVLVGDVDEFPGHIACDGASRSEIVVPIVKKGKVGGVCFVVCFLRFVDHGSERHDVC